MKTKSFWILVDIDGRFCLDADEQLIAHRTKAGLRNILTLERPWDQLRADEKLAHVKFDVGNFKILRLFAPRRR